MTRREARELAMQMFYAMEACKDFSPQAMEDFLAEHPAQSKQREYIQQVYATYADHAEAIDELLDAALQNWKRGRLSKVDLAVMRVALAESRFSSPGVPESVAISEAVTIAKKYGSEESGKFVNGVLGRISRGETEEKTSKIEDSPKEEAPEAAADAGAFKQDE